MLFYKTQLSFDGQDAVECLPITPDSPLGLKAVGTVAPGLAEVILRIDDHDELVADKVGGGDVVLERAGRSMVLRKGHPIRICQLDTLVIAGVSICLVKSSYIVSKSSLTKKIKQLGRVLAASAALCSAFAVAACNDADDVGFGTRGTAPMPKDDIPPVESCKNEGEMV